MISEADDLAIDLEGMAVPSSVLVECIRQCKEAGMSNELIIEAYGEDARPFLPTHDKAPIRPSFADFNSVHEASSGRFARKVGSGLGSALGPDSSAGKMVEGKQYSLGGVPVAFVGPGSISQRVKIMHPNGKIEEIYRKRLEPLGGGTPTPPPAPVLPKIVVPPAPIIPHTPPPAPVVPVVGKRAPPLKMVKGQEYKMVNGKTMVFVGPDPTVSQRVLMKDPVTGLVVPVWRQKLARPDAPAPAILPSVPKVTPPAGSPPATQTFIPLTEMPKLYSASENYDTKVKPVTAKESWASTPATQTSNVQPMVDYHTLPALSADRPETWNSNSENAFLIASVQSMVPIETRAPLLTGPVKNRDTCANYKRTSKTLQMFGVKANENTTLDQQETFRHEFGHALDHRLGSGGIGYDMWSSEDFTFTGGMDTYKREMGKRHKEANKLLKTAEDHILSNGGYGSPASKQVIDDLTNTFPELRGVDMVEHVKQNYSAYYNPPHPQGATKNGVPVSRKSYSSISDGNDPTRHEKAAVRLLSAMRHGDLAGALYIGKSRIDNGNSDIMDGLTNGSHYANGWSGHGQGYWTRHRGKGGYTETFAHLVATAGGTDANNWKVTKRLMPDFAPIFEARLSRMQSVNFPETSQLKPNGRIS